jgi:SH3 domain-containing protein
MSGQLQVTVTDLNVRDAPSTDGTIVGHLGLGDVVDWLDTSADGSWQQIQTNGLIGWAAQQFLAQVVAPTALAALDPIIQIASGSAIAQYSWKNRGVAPIGYIKGMALAYGRVYCKFNAGDPCAAEMAKANTGNGSVDALAWLAPEFAAAGLDNSTDGVDTLRHLFVLLVGLGMRESSGIYCTGRDQSASNTTADTAEAGLFQTSFNARGASALLPALFQVYQASPAGFLDVFQEGVNPCGAADMQNFGSGDGAEFQRLSKACPAFAAEFAAVGLRNLRTHWGPINTKTAEIKTECDDMLLQVQQAVDASGLCSALS